jgi:16S rRNA (adenine1518-N6/adenine1519-N6)-dimethyltransferase
VIRAKKSLGQNFLIDKDIIDTIINTVSITDNEILEVGPWIRETSPERF